MIRLLEGIINLLRGISLFFRLSSFWQIILYLLIFAGIGYLLFWGIKSLFFSYFKRNWHKYYIQRLDVNDWEKHLKENPNRVMIEYLLALTSALRQDFHHEINQEIALNSDKYSNYENVVNGVKEALLKLKNELENTKKITENNVTSTQLLNSQFKQLIDTVSLQNEQIKEYQSGFFASHSKVLIENLLSVLDVIRNLKTLSDDDKNQINDLMEMNVLRPMHITPLEINLGDAFDHHFMKALPIEKSPPKPEDDEKVYVIVQKGYRVVEGDVIKLIRPCLVKIYKDTPKTHSKIGDSI